MTLDDLEQPIRDVALYVFYGVRRVYLNEDRSNDPYYRRQNVFQEIENTVSSNIL